MHSDIKINKLQLLLFRNNLLNLDRKAAQGEMHVAKQPHFSIYFPLVTVNRLDRTLWEAFAKYCPLNIVFLPVLRGI